MRTCNAKRGATMSGSKDQGADIDELIKDAGNILDAWKKAIDEIAKDLAKLDKPKGGSAGGKDGGKKDGGNKQQQQAQKDADAASKKLNEDLKRMLQGQKPPSDPKQAPKFTDFLQKYIDKNGVKLKDWGSLKPDIDFDPKKMQLKKFELVWTWKF
jgi:Sec-independent protein translocase protein TatA